MEKKHGRACRTGWKPPAWRPWPRWYWKRAAPEAATYWAEGPLPKAGQAPQPWGAVCYVLTQALRQPDPQRRNFLRVGKWCIAPMLILEYLRAAQ